MAITGKAMIFEDLKTDISAHSISYMDFKPIAALDQNRNTFIVPRDQEYFWDLEKSRIVAKAKMVDHQGNDLTPGNQGIINDPGQTMWESLECSYNGTQTRSAYSLQHMRGYIENLLFETEGQKDTDLSSELWRWDTTMNFDQTDLSPPVPTDPIRLETGKNEGYSYRYKFVSGSQHFKLSSKIHDDMFLQPKWMVPGVEISMTLTRSSNSFVLMDGDNKGPKLVLLDLTLKMCRVVPQMPLYEEIKAKWEHEPAVYPFYETEVQVRAIPTGSQDFRIDNPFTGSQVPDYVYFALVSAERFNGDYKKNPLLLDTFRLKKLSVRVNGYDIPERPLEMEYMHEQGMEGYAGLCKTLDNLPNGLDYLRFMRGYAVFGFELLPSTSADFSRPPTETGTLVVVGHIATPTTEDVKAILIGKKQAKFKINNFGQVYRD